MKKFFLHLCLFLPLLGLEVLAARPELRFGVETHSATLHQGFLFQISVQHDKEPAPPVLPPMKDFLVQAQPPQKSSFSNVSFVNGRKTSSSYIRTLFNYTMIPQKLGQAVIPAVTVIVDGRKYHTRPITIQVSKQKEYPGIFLETSFSARKCYVGEPVMIHWTWGFDRDIHGFSANLPVFQNQDFHFPDYLPPIDQQRYKYHEIGNLQQKRIIARQTQIRRNGTSQACLKFQQPFIPTRAGTYSIPVSGITCEITDSSRQTRRSDPFDDMDDFMGDFGGFFSSRRRPLKKITVVSKPFTLEVLPLPVEGRPSSFSGIIGSCRITASASPLEVNVGEPIILTLQLSGPSILDKLQLPDLEKQENIASSFKVSSSEPGIIKNGSKIFQRTLRANSPAVTKIPPVEISYFNSQTGKYEIARSQPIAIKVTAAREITARDMEGLQNTPAVPPGAQGSAPEEQELQATTLGIAHNYDSSELLYRQSADFLSWLRRPPVALLLGLPVLIWICLFTGNRLRHQSRSSREERRIKKAVAHCLKQLKQLKAGQNDGFSRLYEILQNYFCLRLPGNPGTISARDLRQASDSNPELQKSALPVLEDILQQCEFNQFSGADRVLTEEQLKQTARALQIWEKHCR